MTQSSLKIRRSALPFIASLLLAVGVTTACGSSDPKTDSSKMLDRDGFVAELRTNFPKYKWPSDYQPNLDTLVQYAAPPDGSVIPPGGTQLILGIYSQCAWGLSWYDAYERGDSAQAAEALTELTEYVPTLQGSVGGGQDISEQIARQASLGDASQALSYAEANCGPNFWKDIS